jgi:hypothetical protein
VKRLVQKEKLSSHAIAGAREASDQQVRFAGNH